MTARDDTMAAGDPPGRRAPRELTAGSVLGLDGKTYPPRLSVDDRRFLFGRVHYLSHDERLSVRQIIDRLIADHGVQRSVGWVSSTLRKPCTACVQARRNETPEHPAAGSAG
ncbi:hypothetical protein JBE04_08245 [Streptomyces sp. PRKS01-29]|nr:hypothetical protein [Streptomyces sabulosicollis]MBI0294471.1 hypothetical protein [Streptomyces sabulosicollis]